MDLGLFVRFDRICASFIGEQMVEIRNESVNRVTDLKNERIVLEIFAECVMKLKGFASRQCSPSNQLILIGNTQRMVGRNLPVLGGWVVQIHASPWLVTYGPEGRVQYIGQFL